MRSQGGPRRAWPRRREEMVRASARVRGAPARVERPLATTPRVELPVREHAPRSGGGAPITSCLIPLTVACQAHVASSSATPTRKFQRRARARVVGAAWVWVGLRWAPGARQLWGARLRVDHRPDGALASSAELSGSAEPSGRAVAASPGCRTRRQVSAGRRRCAQSSCATETSSRSASEPTEHLLELRKTSPAARARQSGLTRPLEPKVDEARVRSQPGPKRVEIYVSFRSHA